MFKVLKTKYRNWKLKNRLVQEQEIFNTKNYVFKSVNVLIIDELIPEYDKDSGSRRLTEIIKLLLQKKVAVFLLADLKQYKYKSDYIARFKALGVNVYEPCVDKNNKLITKELFIKKISPNIDIAWLHRPTIFKKYNELIKTHNPKIKLIFDMVDFHYLRLIREWEYSKVPKIKAKAKHYLKIELDNCKKADYVVVISKEDKIELNTHYDSSSKMVVIGNIHHFIAKTDTFIAPHKRDELLFVGGFKHQPNEDAVLYLHRKIMPLVWQHYPDIKVNIVGSYPTKTVLGLHSNKFNVTGFVEDVSKYYKTAKLFVAPLRYGAGIKGKIGQSFEYSLPVVTTTVGAEGFDFSPYHDAMIANDAAHFSNKIMALYSNNKLWEEVSANSEKIISPFSLQQISHAIDSLLTMALNQAQK